MSNLISLVKDQEQLFNQSLASKDVSFNQECQFAIQSLQKNDFLAKVAMNNKSSIQNAIINVAAIGISLNPASKHAYLVPRDGMVCLDISYMGLMHLAMSTGSIKWGQARLVRQNDTYLNKGIDKPPEHHYSAFGDRGDIIGAYCTVKTSEGDYLTEEMSIDQIMQVKNTSKAKNGPWSNWFDEMARKTVVKRASKYWPKVERLQEAVNYLNTEGGEGLEELEYSLPESYLNEIDDLENILGVSNSFKSVNASSVEMLKIEEAQTIIDRMKATRALLDQVNFIKESLANEDWINAYDTLHSLTDEEKGYLWIAPTKGGIFTTEERKIMKESLKTKYDEACEMALDNNSLNNY